MRKLVALVALLGIAAGTQVGAVAAADKKDSRAKVLWAKLRVVPVGDYGELARVKGKAHLVDGKRKDKLTIHVRRLQPGDVYAWHIHKAPEGVTRPCRSARANAPGVPGWRYRKLRANRAGNANAKAVSTTFKAQRGAVYYVDVHLAGSGAAPGPVLACGVLERKGKGKRGKDKDKSRDDDKRGSDKDRGRPDKERGRDRARGRGPADRPAEREARRPPADRPGKDRADDKPRGDADEPQRDRSGDRSRGRGRPE